MSEGETGATARHEKFQDFNFEFFLPPSIFQQLIIKVRAISDSRLFKRSSSIGSFKIDVATVKSQPDNCFIHKWALLLDSNDPLSGPKGFVKCDLIVCTPGVVPKIPEGISRDDEDIEGNLLIPEDFSKNIERQPARYFVTIFEAKDLPAKTSGVMASMKKAFVGDAPKELVDPFVQVSFAGRVGKTSVKKNCANPKWNEEIVFYEMFPSLVKIIRIHIKEDTSVIATNFLDFSLIADNSMNGFLPTFGPSWLNLYGNHRDNSEESPLNYGVGEGLAYRGCLKLSLSVEILDEFPKRGMHTVEISNIQQNQTNLDMIPMERFLFFCTIFEADMIDKKYAGKPAYFEISFGKEGLTEIGEQSTKKPKQELGENLYKNSNAKTPSSITTSADKLFCSILKSPKKPCMHLTVDSGDFRKRLFMINRIKNFSSDIRNTIKEIKVYSMNNDISSTKHYCITTIDKFSDYCSFIIDLLECEYLNVDVATFLDLEKQRQRKREMDVILKTLLNLKKRLDICIIQDVINTLENCLPKLKMLAIEPQDCLPDVFMWFICDNKKIAYKRFRPEDMLFSLDDNERGTLCSKIQSFFLKNPNSNDSNDQILGYHLKAYFWLGTVNEIASCITNLPPLFRTYDSDLIDDFAIPNAVEYTEVNDFELRCHLFQGRSLIGSDDSGLSDPFIRLLFNGECYQSQVIEQTLCPLWDECIVFPKVTLYGSFHYISNHPPFVIAQVYDFDKLGENEFLGQTEIGCVVKLAFDVYDKPKFPPSLECCSLIKNNIEVGEILAVCELIQLGPNVEPYPELPIPEIIQNNSVRRIPSSIKPLLHDYQLQVLFWGLRDLKANMMLPVDQPKIQIDWGSGNGILESESIISYKKNPNFKTMIKTVKIKLPEDINYQPPITIRCVDARAFGRNVLIGTCTVTNIGQYILQFVEEKDDVFGCGLNSSGLNSSGFSMMNPLKSLKASQKFTTSMPNLTKLSADEQHALKTSTESLTFDKQSSSNLAVSFFKSENLEQIGLHPRPKENSEPNIPSTNVTDPSATASPVMNKNEVKNALLDWWSKYYASFEALEEKKRHDANPRLYQKSKVIPTKKLKDFGKKLFTSKTDLLINLEHQKPAKTVHDLKKLNIAKFQIYDTELESVQEFNGFKDCFEVFNLYRGKNVSNELNDSARIVGKFKGLLCLQKTSDDTQPFLIPRHFNNEPIKVMVRIYIIKAFNLRPSDPTGKADPYLNIILGRTKICDKVNKIISQLNPVFGRYFEIEANFPEETELLIQIFDWDRLSSDDLMGETKIDLEQRFYSKHKASCGLSSTYESTGYNAWRDSLKPTQILMKLCKLYGLTGPTYTKTGVTVEDKTFTVLNKISDKDPFADNENLAVSCLRQLKDIPKVGFSLVPEHIETRTLYLPEKPGMEQGKLELWIDMFPIDGQALPAPINITPRKPKSFELRVIVWDTKDVILDDYNVLTQTASVDQYIKCFLIGPDVDGQHTDVHYRSLNGDGNFNWRFIFKFDYFDAEEKIVHHAKESIFSLVKKEEKTPAKLNLQVWDADVISADDFLGNLTLNLTKIPRGAKSAKSCSMDLLKPHKDMKHKSFLNLFDVKRTRGWFPFVRHENKGAEIAGKVDLELQLMTAEDAEKKPAGQGRDAPDPMPPPQRPETSFAWFSSPFKMFKYDIWIGMRWKCLQLFLLVLLLLFICIFIYTLPEAIAQKIVQSSL